MVFKVVKQLPKTKNIGLITKFEKDFAGVKTGYQKVTKANPTHHMKFKSVWDVKL